MKYRNLHDTRVQISYFHDHAQCVIPTLLAGHSSYKYHAFQDKSNFFFLFSRSFRYRAQCLFLIVLSGSQDSVRLLRHVARLNSGNYTLCVIVKVAYSSFLGK